jgi:hypothetical protein
MAHPDPDPPFPEHQSGAAGPETGPPPDSGVPPTELHSKAPHRGHPHASSPTVVSAPVQTYPD